jgi:outer membrane receptor for ferrienterochelin and colicins
VGVVSASIFYHDLENVIERIDVSPSPTQLDSANGNIGDGERYGLIANASLRLGIINLPNVLATSRFTLQDSEVTDPFLGISRRTERYPRGSLEMGFRHDLPRYNLNYGLNWNNRFDNNRKRYDLEDIEIDAVDPLWDAFVEVILFGDVTLRLDAKRFIVTHFCRERQRFVGAISSGIIEEIEDSCNASGRTLALKVNGSF